MTKRISIIIAVLVLLSLVLPSLALAQGPTEDFETVRSAIETWLASNPKIAVTVDEVYDNLNDGDTSNDPFILSVRKPEDYEKGHVPGAVNIPWNQIAKPESLEQLPTDQPILDYCYTGHTGQVAMTSLNLMGYKTDNMKWGMMAWTKNDDVLATARFDPAAVPDYRVETEPNEATETYDFPALETGATGEAEVIRTAVDNYLSSGKAPTISADALFENLNDGDESNDPVILSVRKPEDYAKGHIPGAINIPLGQLANPETLAKLPPDMVKESNLAGEPIRDKLTRAPGNNAPIGGLKVIAAGGWFAARPSGTENIYKIYAESFKDQAHLDAIVNEAQGIVNSALDGA